MLRARILRRGVRTKFLDPWPHGALSQKLRIWKLETHLICIRIISTEQYYFLSYLLRRFLDCWKKLELILFLSWFSDHGVIFEIWTQYSFRGLQLPVDHCSLQNKKMISSEIRQPFFIIFFCRVYTQKRLL